MLNCLALCCVFQISMSVIWAQTSVPRPAPTPLAATCVAALKAICSMETGEAVVVRTGSRGQREGRPSGPPLSGPVL